MAKSTDEFIKENVPRGTSEVPQLDAEGRLIDEREEIRSESQRMLNRLQSQPSKLPPGLRRTVAATKARDTESMFPAAAPARDLLSGIIGASPTAPGSEAYRTGQALANMPPVQAAAAIPAKIASAAGDAATALASLGGAGVIKSKGGNWFKDLNSVEGQLQWLKSSPTVRQNPPDVLERMIGPGKMALDNWVDKKLTKYIKNEMGTPEDPIRELAERGILHFPIYDFNAVGLGEKRQQAGMPIGLQGQSREAQFWEQTADRLIDFTTPSKIKREATHGAKEHQRNYAKDLLEENPWIEKVPANTKIYKPSVSDDLIDNAGFGHLVDELENAMHPESDLPNALRIQPKDLEKMNVPQAVERVAKINDWRINNKKALAIEETNKADLYKAYPEQKYRWIQLNKPGQFAAESDAMGHSVRGYEPPEKGGSPFYGLGGWEAIQSGEAKVYSLRDAKGQSHATIEVKHDISAPDEGDIIAEMERFNPGSSKLQGPEGRIAYDEAMNRIIKSRPAVITQIKGEGNAAIKENFLPFVQDFVRSGNWSDVKDLQNTGLMRLNNQFVTKQEFEPMRENALRFLSEHPSFEPARRASEEYFNFSGKIPSREYTLIQDAIGEPVAPNIPYTWRELSSILDDPGAWDSYSVSNAFNITRELARRAGVEGFARGGEVKLKHGGPVDKTTAFIKAHA